MGFPLGVRRVLVWKSILSPARAQPISCRRNLCRSSLGPGAPLEDLQPSHSHLALLQALWTRNNAAVVYPCHAVIVTLQIQTGEQRFFIGHTDKVSVTLFTQPYSDAVLVPQMHPCSQLSSKAPKPGASRRCRRWPSTGAAPCWLPRRLVPRAWCDSGTSRRAAASRCLNPTSTPSRP